MGIFLLQSFNLIYHFFQQNYEKQFNLSNLLLSGSLEVKAGALFSKINDSWAVALCWAQNDSWAKALCWAQNDSWAVALYFSLVIQVLLF